MLVGIHQLHYLPWLRYVEKIAHCDVFVVLDNIQFNKNGWQNRNRLKTASGQTLLTVPVHARAGQTLDQVRIADNNGWKQKHWRTLEQNYKKAPCFNQYAPFFEEIYDTDWTHLNDLNRKMLEYFITALGIDTRIVHASSLNVPGDATERLLNIIRAVDGDTYYSGAFALDAYLDSELLDSAGIKLELQNWSAPRYPQLHGDFIPDLSVLDLLMNCGPGALQHLNGKKND